MAVDKRDTAIAEYLIDHGANIDYPEDWGPLQDAIYNIEMLKFLLEKGANINGGSWPLLMLHFFGETQPGA